VSASCSCPQGRAQEPLTAQAHGNGVRFHLVVRGKLVDPSTKAGLDLWILARKSVRHPTSRVAACLYARSPNCSIWP